MLASIVSKYTYLYLLYIYICLSIYGRIHCIWHSRRCLYFWRMSIVILPFFSIIPVMPLSSTVNSMLIALVSFATRDTQLFLSVPCQISSLLSVSCPLVPMLLWSILSYVCEFCFVHFLCVALSSVMYGQMLSKFKFFIHWVI